ncbi:HD domain-containing phosphohydrolase [Ampullimonas aquatilis]|uniref:HD domain-containing phosphohydrolase n=1 Tax=Ampullimonas aquatilis TaxID=1341549 RepID=UPI003C758D34
MTTDATLMDRVHDTGQLPVQTPATPAIVAGPSLLLVDDEPNILQALRRLFRAQGYQITLAHGGQEALDIMQSQSFDLVISDMRMPEMNGAQFLAQAYQKWPETMRILLTGYADIASTVEAINDGHIFRYIAKPWQDADILLVVKQALEMKLLAEEKLRLERLTQQQNEQLKQFNQTLEAKVKARTSELEQTMGFLELANGDLKKNFINSVKVFSGLIELRAGSLAGHSRRVADMAKAIAVAMKLPGSEVQDVVLASYLHDVGKIGLSDEVLDKPFLHLTTDERKAVMAHPAKGQQVLMAMEQLQVAAQIIRSHHERHDGEGFPDGLAGAAIPIGARIVAVANDFDALQIGTLQAKKLSREESIALIKKNAGKRYDPDVVEAFCSVVVSEVKVTQSEHEREVASNDLKPGMKLARDIVARDGLLLLAADHVLDARVIEQIKYYERTDGKSLHVCVLNVAAG